MYPHMHTRWVRLRLNDPILPAATIEWPILCTGIRSSRASSVAAVPQRYFHSPITRTGDSALGSAHLTVESGHPYDMQPRHLWRPRQFLPDRVGTLGRGISRLESSALRVCTLFPSLSNVDHDGALTNCTPERLCSLLDHSCCAGCSAVLLSQWRFGSKQHSLRPDWREHRSMLWRECVLPPKQYMLGEWPSVKGQLYRQNLEECNVHGRSALCETEYGFRSLGCFLSGRSMDMRRGLQLLQQQLFGFRTLEHSAEA